jgi:uncharacterized protein (TIGR04255 family)
MNITDSSLPHYKKPPVIEVVCGVQFDELKSFSSVHFGLFGQRIQKDYPKTEERPPLAQVFEGGPSPDMRGEIFLDLPPLRRVFYIDQTDNFLLQVQPSRFLVNWRKQRESDEYPRFAVAHDRFLSGWNTFLAFLKDLTLGIPQANQYELTYINHIFEGEEAFPIGIQHYLPLFSWKSGQSIKFLPTPRSVNFLSQFTLPDSKGTLHVTVTHGRRAPGGKGVLVLDLTARGPARKDWSDMEDWFSMAHEWIVRGFTDLTSPVAHQAWERQK